MPVFLKNHPKNIRPNIGIIIFMLLPQNDWFEMTEDMTFKIISYILLTIYDIIVFANFLAFFRLARRVKEMKKVFTSIALGAVCRIIYVISKLITAFYAPLYFLVGSTLILVLSMVLIYIGFIQPATSSFKREDIHD